MIVALSMKGAKFEHLWSWCPVYTLGGNLPKPRTFNRGTLKCQAPFGLANWWFVVQTSTLMKEDAEADVFTWNTLIWFPLLYRNRLQYLLLLPPGCRSWPLCRSPQTTIKEIIAKTALKENTATLSLHYSERPVWFHKLLFSFMFATPVVCSNAFPQEAEPELYSRGNSETRRQAGPHFWKLTFNFNCSFPRYFRNYSSVQTEQERKRSRSNVDFKKPWTLALVYHLVFILNIAIKTKQTLSACLLYIKAL